MNFSALAEKEWVILLKYLTLEGLAITLEVKAAVSYIGKAVFPTKTIWEWKSAEFSTHCIAIC